MTSSSKSSRLRGRAVGLMLIVVAIVAVAITAAGVVYTTTISTPTNRDLEDRAEHASRMTGLVADAVKNGLDARFTDKDGDLVADAAEPGSQIDPPVLKFSFVASEGADEAKGVWKDFAAALSQATRKPVDVVAFNSSDDQLQALRAGELHVAALSTGNVPIGVNVAGFVPVAALAGENGKSSIQMEIITPADSSLRSLKDLKGHELTLTEAGSNSGYRAPLEVLRSGEGLLIERDYTVRFSGGQTQSIKGIADKTYEAAAVANDVLRREVAAGTIRPEQFRSIYKSENFPSAGFGYVSTLKPELAEKVREMLLHFTFKGTSVEPYFATSGQVGFAPVKYREDWAFVRRIDDALAFKYEIHGTPNRGPETPPSSGPSTRP